MFPWIARFGLLLIGERVFRRVARHPRLAPIVATRKGRLAMLALAFALRRHRRTRVAGHALRHAHRWSRRIR